MSSQMRLLTPENTTFLKIKVFCMWYYVTLPVMQGHILEDFTLSKNIVRASNIALHLCCKIQSFNCVWDNNCSLLCEPNKSPLKQGCMHTTTIVLYKVEVKNIKVCVETQNCTDTSILLKHISLFTNSERVKWYLGMVVLTVFFLILPVVMLVTKVHKPWHYVYSCK
jgi:hypothetical protein